jgi:hypothetical protein
MLKSVIQGYSDHIFDLQLIAVHQGYWSGYYNRAKKPKSLESVIKKMFKAKEKENTPRKKEKSNTVDVDSFLAMERLRLSQMKK